MERKPLRVDQMDRQAYEEATRQFQMVQKVLPQDAVEKLAQEVVRRLKFRLPRGLHASGMPNEEEIDQLCEALLSPDPVAGDRIILAARKEGASPEQVYLGYVAEAARQLGIMWEEDQVTFADVSVASSRLYRIIRGLRHVIDTPFADASNERHVLFALVPGDTHTLGIEMATDLFRRDGWDVTLSVGDAHDDIVARTEDDRFRAIVLVAHSERTLPNLISLVLALRITQPMAHIVVAGNIVGQHEDVDILVGADDVIADVETAVARLRAIIGSAS